MANNHFSSPFQPIEKLAGRDNYRSWAIAMRAYLEVEELWDTLKAPANGQLNSDPKKLQKTRGRLVLAIGPEVYAHIEDAQSPQQVWEKLEQTYDDKGLRRKVHLLLEVVTTKLENCKSMEDYVSRIISASCKLAAIGTKLQEDVVGALLLAGLPPSFKLMIIALSNSGKDVTADFVEVQLLQESQSDTSGNHFESRGLYAQAPSAP